MRHQERGFLRPPSGPASPNRPASPQAGAALVLVIVLTTISLIFTAGLLHMVTTGAQMSGGAKRYKTALEAAKAGNAWVKEVVDTHGSEIPTGLTKSACFDEKMKNATADWTGSCTDCDLSFQMGDYTVCGTVVDTIVGETGEMSPLVITGVVLPGSGGIPSKAQPYLYTMEYVAQHNTQPSERAILQVLYQF